MNFRITDHLLCTENSSRKRASRLGFTFGIQVCALQSFNHVTTIQSRHFSCMNHKAYLAMLHRLFLQFLIIVFLGRISKLVVMLHCWGQSEINLFSSSTDGNKIYLLNYSSWGGEFG